MKTRRKSRSDAARRQRSVRAADPFLERERARYDRPLPSREYILQILESRGVPVDEDDLAALLEIEDDERGNFGRRLAAMEREGQIMRNRKDAICVVGKLRLISGVVQGHPDGFGFVLRDDGEDDLFLSPGQMRAVMHGDRVLVREGGMGPRGRREAAVVEVLERAQSKLVGRFTKEHGIALVIPEDRRISQDVLIPGGGARQAKPGQVVVAEIVEQPTRHSQPIGRILEVLGDYGDPGMEIEIALRKHRLPYEFPREVERACRRFQEGVTSSTTRFTASAAAKVTACGSPLPMSATTCGTAIRSTRRHATAAIRCTSRAG
mgnify:CR=1 FL=1